jgi:hypothetical protein
MFRRILLPLPSGWRSLKKEGADLSGTLVVTHKNKCCRDLEHQNQDFRLSENVKSHAVPLVILQLYEGLCNC